SLAINPVRNARVADAADLTERQADLPMVLAEPVSRDAALAESYRRLLYAARAEPATLSGELLTEAQAQQLKQHLGSPVVMVVMLWGQSVSTAVDVPKVSGCAVFASVCGRGFTPDLDKSRALASVFDLDARAVIWTQVIRFPLGDASLLFAGGDPARMDNYSGLGWMEDLTRPFFR
ncbi:MAG TPA: hypothetical protein VHE37_13250, partial [Nevskiaceae bacterium]|nr:hypothetical protein [Nevskiaceae bacterium]